MKSCMFLDKTQKRNENEFKLKYITSNNYPWAIVVVGTDMK